MNKNKEKSSKLNKGQIITKIVAFILVILMILSMCATCIYYFFTLIK